MLAVYNRAVKFGVTGVNAGRRVEGANAAVLARLAEEAGFESLWAVEHVVVPANYKSQYPYSPDGRMPGKEEVSIGDPLIWLTYAAAVTERINLATGILILPQRNPVLLAKECATLDTLVERPAAARDRRRVAPGGVRGARRTVRGTWRPHRRVRRGAARPLGSGGADVRRPVLLVRESEELPEADAEAIPIIVGGHTDAAARRAGRIGDGFFPWGLGAEHLTRLIGVMRDAAQEAGRDPDAIEITAGAMDVDTIRTYADAGCEPGRRSGLRAHARRAEAVVRHLQRRGDGEARLGRCVSVALGPGARRGRGRMLLRTSSCSRPCRGVIDRDR